MKLPVSIVTATIGNVVDSAGQLVDIDYDGLPGGSIERSYSVLGGGGIRHTNICGRVMKVKAFWPFGANNDPSILGWTQEKSFI